MGRPYGEPAYRAAAAALKADPQPCWRRCGAMANTIDHVPALSRHHHVAESGCCALLPCCGPCNYRAGQALRSADRARARPTASRKW